jgi:hypothetical protein
MLWGGAALLWLTAAASGATTMLREPETLQLGERVLVDDGSCPTGQILEVTGVSSKGSAPPRVERLRRCIRRGR